MTIPQIRPELVTQFNNVKANGARGPITLIPFDKIRLGEDQRPYLVKGLVPREGLTIVWGPPKSGKSFKIFDLCMHVALGWEYRGRRVRQGPVVYCAFEGQSGMAARVAAFRLECLAEDSVEIPFYAQTMTLDLMRQSDDLIQAIRANEICPAVVTLDTLNRSLHGSENSDEDMGNYIKAADAKLLIAQ